MQHSQAASRHDLSNAFGVARRDGAICVHNVVLEAHADLAASSAGRAKAGGFICTKCTNGPVKIRQDRGERLQPFAEFRKVARHVDKRNRQERKESAPNRTVECRDPTGA